jgi:hypothetical protein
VRVAALVLVLASCGGEEQYRGWEIGPVINGRNYSLGLPNETDGTFPISPTAQPHYVTKPSGPLTGKTAIRLRYRVEGNATIHGAGCGALSPSKVTIYFQREGDNWAKEGYRWWATFASQRLTAAGEYEITAPLSGRWTGIESANAYDDKPLFDKALEETARVGFTFANCTGYGHGAQATGPMRFTIVRFEVI